jgi:hypothetical protein
METHTMNAPTRIQRKTVLRSLQLLCAIPALTFGSSVMAQPTGISTTAQLKAACETSLNRTVRFSVDAQINAGGTPEAPEQVVGGCRIELLSGADLKLDKVGLAFSGPLTIVGSGQAGVAMQESTLAANSVVINFGSATGSYVSSQQSRIDATVGNLNITFGVDSKLEVYGARIGGSQLSNAAFAAVGAINITSGLKHGAVLMDTGLVAGGNVRLAWNGMEADLKMEDSSAHSMGGNVIFNFASGRAKFETKESSLRAPLGDVTVALRGGISAMKAYDMVFEAGNALQIFGVAGSTHLELNTATLTAGGAIFMASSALNASVSTLDVSKAIVRGGNSIRFIGGHQSKVVVKDSDIAGTDLVEASVYFSSVCEVQNNVIVAPRQLICQ